MVTNARDYDERQKHIDIRIESLLWMLKKSDSNSNSEHWHFAKLIEEGYPEEELIKICKDKENTLQKGDKFTIGGQFDIKKDWLYKISFGLIQRRSDKLREYTVTNTSEHLTEYE